MARIYEIKRTYLLENIWIRFFLGVYVFILFIGFVTPSIISVFNLNFRVISFPIYILDFIGVGVLVIVLHLLNRADKFFYGLISEKKIQKILSQLPDNYTVFANIMPPSALINNDFVVIGPAGIFAIEVKDYGGNIGFNGRNLIHNGKPFYKNKDGLKETMDETWNIHNYLKEHKIPEVFIYPILVFEKKDYLHFETDLIKNVKILGKSSLLKYIESKSNYNYPVSREMIEKKIKLLVTQG